MVNAQHAAVFGDSGEGKTALLIELKETINFPVIVCDHADKWPVDSGRTYATLETMREKVREGVKGEVFVHRSERLDSKQIAANCMQLARDIRDTYDAPVCVIYDEADTVLAGDWDKPAENPVAWGLHEGRSEFIKVVAATQDPQDLPYGPLKQCKTLTWVGRPAGFHGPFLSHSISDAIDKEIVYSQDQYEYTVFDKRGQKLYGSETVPYE